MATLDNAYAGRFRQFQEDHDVESAIEHQEQAGALVEDSLKTDDPVVLDPDLSDVSRFQSTGALKDTDEAIQHQTIGSGDTPENHVERPEILRKFGTTHKRRFGRLDTAENMQKAIDLQVQAIFLTPDGHADRPEQLSDLAFLYLAQYERFGELAGIDRAIACQTESVSLIPDGHEEKPRQFNDLGLMYRCRYERFGKLADIDRAIACHTEAVSPILNGHADKPGRVNVSGSFSNLGGSYQYRFMHLGELADIERAIECNSKAVSLTPDGHADKPGMFDNLGSSYLSRFERLGELADVDRAIACGTESISLTPDGHADKPGCLNNLGISYHSRFNCLGELADINWAIACLTGAVSQAPEGHADKPRHLHNLGTSYQSRFQRLGELADIERAIACQTEAASLTPEGHANQPALLNNLGSLYQFRFEHLGELADIEKAIAYKTEAVCLTPEGHADKPGRLDNLGSSYKCRFQRLEELVDINRAITCQTQAVSLTPDDHADKSVLLTNLSSSYLDRGKNLGELTDVVQAISCLQLAAQSPIGRSSTRFHASRRWAALASLFNHPTTLLGYQHAMALVPHVIWIGSTINHRYDDMHSTGAVAVEAAAAAISAKQYGLALEWLEAGRTIIWNQTLQLRTPFDELSESAPDLAKNLKQVAQELETVGQRDTSVPATNSQALELTAQKHRRLAENYEKMLAEARRLPGFHDFMRPKKVVELMLAAKHGPVVIVNVDSDRCDALILRPQSEDVAHIPLPDISHSDIEKMQRQTKGWIVSRGKRHQRPVVSGNRALEQPKTVVAKILSELWHRIVKPILDFLGYNKFAHEELLPHVTWCTTGALSFLPIHAAGCYDPAGPKIFDFVVSSYTPSLSALISAASGSLEVDSILAVSQEDDILLNTSSELAHIQRHTVGLPYKQLERDQATPEAVLDAMVKYNTVHLACHGQQNTERAAKSCFLLHGGSLTLEEITKRSLKNKGLAFLSACQTATGDEQMPDEAVHLAAGMLVAGYPTVIATMWSIEDADAPKVADLVYGNVLRDGKLGDGRAARALHAAVKELRKEIGEDKFDRWIPYIHIGA